MICWGHFSVSAWNMLANTDVGYLLDISRILVHIKGQRAMDI